MHGSYSSALIKIAQVIYNPNISIVIDLITRLKDDMVYKITEFFLEVIETNINNVDTIVLLYKVMFFSEKVITYIIENSYLGILIEQYEKIMNQIIREFDTSDRSSFINENLRNYFYGSSDFHSNLSKHIQNIGNSNPFEIPTSVPSNNPDDDFEPNRNNMTPVITFEPHPNETLGNQGGNNNPNSEQSSFYLPAGNTTHQGSHNKSVKIPTLNLPVTFNDNINTVSRSTRRADPYKSVSTNSNRVSNYGIGSISVDYGAKEKTFHKTFNESNMSILENDNSYVYDDSTKVGAYQSAQEKMKTLANQLGEYCLTIDLGCLLAQKRKLQLDQVAKVAVFHGKCLF